MPKLLPVLPALLIVNATDDIDDGSCDSVHCSLREAIKAANERDGPDNIIFDTGVFPSQGAGVIEITSVLEITNENTTIDALGAGVIVDGSHSGGDGFIIRSSGNTIRGIRLQNITGVGVWIGYASGIYEIYNNTVDGVTVADSGYGIDGKGRADGMWIMAYCQGCKAIHNQIINCTIENGADDGIEVWSYAGGVVDDNLVAGNKVVNVAEVGIEIDVHGPGSSTNRNTVANNLVQGTKEQAGIYINPWLGGSASENIIYGNTVVDNMQEGISIGAEGSGTRAVANRIVNNWIERHDNWEIRIGSYNGAVADSNFIIGNTIMGYNQVGEGTGIFLQSNTNIVYYNNFIDMPHAAQDDGNNNRWDNGSEGNYWSDYTGHDDNGDGIGDTPYPVPANGMDNFPLMIPYNVKKIHLPVLLQDH